MADIGKIIKNATEIADEFEIDPKDFFSARERGESLGTQIEQFTVSLTDAAQVLNRSFPEQDESGKFTNVISPVVMPKDSRSYLWIMVALILAFVGIFGLAFSSLLSPGRSSLLFGPHYWILWLGYIGFSIWRNSYVMIPDGCQALITKYGKVEEIVGPGRKWLFHPLKRVGYVVNTTKEYPYNAPIRRAPTQERVEASVDLFLQFRIEEPSEFIFTLGGAQGFAEKLHNAISEVTRALIYEQKAADKLLGNQIRETVYMAATARACGAPAASAFGAGFGGGVWALMPAAKADGIIDAWAAACRAKFPKLIEESSFFTTKAGPAAFRVC